MNIDKLIFPRFKRFKTMNLGLKRLLFLLTFPATMMGIAGVIFGWVQENSSSYNTEFFLGLIAIPMAYILIWTIVRIVFWIIDGFMPDKKSTSTNV